ncbi:MAG: hypothetical protein NT172_13710 [Planctomycetota bacterium]|nr:hypothetical protein [Planctomycetota bacterium]
MAIILFIFIRRFCGSCAPDEGIGPSLIWRFFIGRARPMRASAFIDLAVFWLCAPDESIGPTFAGLSGGFGG